MSDAAKACQCPLCLSTASFNSSSNSPAAASGTYYIDALLANGGADRWNTAIGGAATVTYSFLDSLPAAYIGEDEATGFAAMSDTQKSIARETLGLWSEVANLTFTETTGALGEMRFGTATLPSSAAAWAYYPGAGTGGDVWISNYYANNATPSAGNYAYATFIHEIGHALGLKHPGNYNAGGGGTDGPYLPSGEDSEQYTVMSYTSHTTTSGNPLTPMLYDIAAMQYLYGVNTSTRSGDTTYSWTAGQTVIQTIWDGGGADTIDTANQTANQIIDLRAGAYSSIAGHSNNVAIAYGAVIEHATGGSGADSITGNSAANLLIGGAGNDTLTGGGGNDVFYGGTGSDIVYVNGAGGTVFVSGVETVVGGSASDDRFTLGGGTVHIGAYVDVVIGSTDTDTIILDATENRFIAAALETVVGSSGYDRIDLGNRGSTTTVSGLEVLIGSLNTDVVTLAAGGNVLIAAALETVVGGSGSDRIDLGNRGSTTTVSGLEVLIGSLNTDVVTLAAGGNVLIAAALETVVGGSGYDRIDLGNRGSTTTVSGLEVLIGSLNTDVVTLAAGGNVLIAAALETVVGGSGYDRIDLGNRGSTTTVSGLEVLIGSLNTDVITLAAGGNVMIAAALETVVGGSGYDRIDLGNRGSTTTVSGLEVLIGSLNTDVVTLAAGGTTMIAAALETLIGGAGLDHIDLGNRGSTMTVAGVEEIAGSLNTDVITLGAGGGTLLVSGIETLTGGSDADVATILNGALRLSGGGGADLFTLSNAATADEIGFGSATDGGVAGVASGYDRIFGFQSSLDRVVITDALRTLTDTAGGVANGVISVTSLAAGQLVMGRDEAVVLTPAAGSLTDNGFASFLQALGPVQGAAGASALVVANDGTDSGLYLVQTSSSATVGASDVRMLALFSNTLLTSGNIG